LTTDHQRTKISEIEVQCRDTNFEFENAVERLTTLKYSAFVCWLLLIVCDLLNETFIVRIDMQLKKIYLYVSQGSTGKFGLQPTLLVFDSNHLA